MQNIEAIFTTVFRLFDMGLGLAIFIVVLASLGSMPPEIRKFRLAAGFSGLGYTVGYALYLLEIWQRGSDLHFGQWFILPLNTLFMTFTFCVIWIQWVRARGGHHA